MLILRTLIICALLLLIQFIWWYLGNDHIGHPFLFWILSLSLAYKTLALLYEWFYLSFMTVPTVPPKKSRNRDWTVDMLTTYVPGEPHEMMVDTLRAMVAVQYPHTTYLCDEGNDPYLKKICSELGVCHVYRGSDKSGAKAGNINFTLENKAKGEVCVILDPDHVPVPEFLDRVLPYFEDPKVGFVQSIQGYGNTNENFVARGAAEQTFGFYGPLMMGMQGKGTVQAIGANCAFRREALDSIGGHAWGLCEDLHTSMKLHARKWTSVYIPELLTRGRAPSSLSAYYQQQLKWTRGSFDLLFKVYPKLFWEFTWMQRMHYFLTPLYFFYGLIGLIDLFIPLFSLWSYQVALFISFEAFVWRILPVIVGVFVVRHYAQRFLLDENEKGFHFFGGLLRVGTWWVYLKGFIYAVLGKKVPYLPTPKEGVIENEWTISLPNILVVFLSLGIVIFGLERDWNPYAFIMAGFAVLNTFLLSTVTLVGLQKTLYHFLESLRGGDLRPINAVWYSFKQKVVYRLLSNNLVAALFLLFTVGLLLQNSMGITPRFLEPFQSLSKRADDLVSDTIFSNAEKSDLSVLEAFFKEGRPVYSAAKLKDLRNRGVFFDTISSQFDWRVNDQSLHLKGVQYNPEEEWRDGRHPLTRRQLERDFGLIKAMGANTISRNIPTVYDRNILSVAEETGLQVIYGFDFDPSIDYLNDQDRVEDLKQEILSKIKKFRKAPALIGWKLGNGTWEAFAQHFSEPHLSEVRKAFWMELNEISLAIKQLDSRRPVLTTFDGKDKIWQGMADFMTLAPSIDLVVVNGYDTAVIGQLIKMAPVHPLPPLVLSFYGGLEDFAWNQEGRLLEPSAYEKARSYGRIWNQFIERNRSVFLGGLAYCWMDRYQHTATLYGITDFRGRLKPSYYALKEVWTGVKQTFPLGDLDVRAYWWNGRAYCWSTYQASYHKTHSLEWRVIEDSNMVPVASIKSRPVELGALGHYFLDRYFKYHNKFLEWFYARGYIGLISPYGVNYVPESGSREQRFYLYLSDNQGNVVTASVAVPFQ